MKRFIKATSIFVCLFILLRLAACGNNGEDDGPESADYMAADDLTGVWADGDKNMLSAANISPKHIYLSHMVRQNRQRQSYNPENA